MDVLRIGRLPADCLDGFVLEHRGPTGEAPDYETSALT
jgi:hypothetical protein